MVIKDSEGLKHQLHIALTAEGKGPVALIFPAEGYVGPIVRVPDKKNPQEVRDEEGILEVIWKMGYSIISHE